MSAGRSMRRYAYAGPLAPERRHHDPSTDFGLMLFIATMVIVTVAALTDPVIFAFLARAFENAWGIVAAVLGRHS